MLVLGIIIGILLSLVAILFAIYLMAQNNSPVRQVQKALGRKAIILEPDLLPKDIEGRDVPLDELLWVERRLFALNTGIQQRSWGITQMHW